MVGPWEISGIIGIYLGIVDGYPSGFVTESSIKPILLISIVFAEAHWQFWSCFVLVCCLWVFFSIILSSSFLLKTIYLLL